MTPEPWEHLIGKSRVLDLHTKGIAKYGGLNSDPKDGCVEGSLGNAWTAEGYDEHSEQRIEGLTFAACALFYLAMNHCFGDGNKRAAWMTLIDVLEKLGLSIEASPDEAEEFVRKIADGTVRERRNIVAWIGDRLVGSSRAHAL